MAYAKLIDGRATAEIIFDKLSEETKLLTKKYKSQPGIAVVLIGNDPSSHIYVNAKKKIAKKIGFFSQKIILPEESSQKKVLAIIDELNKDNNIHGVLVQSPPPDHIDEEQIILHIDPKKDVDCFHPYNMGKILIGKLDGFLPCTPSGCIELLRRYQIKTSGKNVVIIGRSNIVGKPLAALLMQKNTSANATVTICHSKTKNIADHTLKADIIISALGQPKFLTADMVRKDAIVIDIGINQINDKTKKSGKRLVGDADFNKLIYKCSWITPVPGGVGPMTIAMLMKNTLLAFKNSFK